MQRQVAEGQMPTYDLIVEAYMPNLDNLKKQAKLILRWHRERHYHRRRTNPRAFASFPEYARLRDSCREL